MRRFSNTNVLAERMSNYYRLSLCGGGAHAPEHLNHRFIWELAGLLFPGAALQAETSSSGFRGLSQGRLQLALRGRNASQAARKEALALVRMLMSTSMSALQQGLDTLSHLHYRPDAPLLITQVGHAPCCVSFLTHQIAHTFTERAMLVVTKLGGSGPDTSVICNTEWL